MRGIAVCSLQKNIGNLILKHNKEYIEFEFAYYTSHHNKEILASSGVVISPLRKKFYKTSELAFCWICEHYNITDVTEHDTILETCGFVCIANNNIRDKINIRWKRELNADYILVNAKLKKKVYKTFVSEWKKHG